MVPPGTDIATRRSPFLFILLLPLLIGGCMTSHRTLIPGEVSSSAQGEEMRIRWVETVDGRKYEFARAGGRVEETSRGLAVMGTGLNGETLMISIDKITELGISESRVSPSSTIILTVVTLTAMVLTIGILTN